MSKAEYALLQDVIMDADFPDLDLALRRGRHVDRDDAAWYSLLSDAQELLEPFYRRYGCELIHKTDGYFYLLPTGDKVSRKQLAPTDMLVGQALALLYLDPAAVERGGVVTQEEIVGQLSAVLGSDALIGLFSPGKRKKQDERIAQRNVRQRVSEAVRRLGNLGFVELNDAGAVRLRAALLRFAEPVRGLSEPAEALAKLVAQGEVALTPEEPGDNDDDSDEERGADDADADQSSVDDPSAASQPDAVDADSAHAEMKWVEDAGAVMSAAPGAADSGEATRTRNALVALGDGSDVLDGDGSGAAGEGGDIEDNTRAAAAESSEPDAWGEPSDSGVVARIDPAPVTSDAADGGEEFEAFPEAFDVAAGESPARADADVGDGGDDEEPRSAELAGAAVPPRAPVPVPVRRAPPADDDLDWADIVLPGQDAEDGS